ncbi:MAG: hypothetical protein EBZ48_00980 [Proteobacteria bacterium]|nr:hypothetical protein [Pseudomonadota bacterium]
MTISELRFLKPVTPTPNNRVHHPQEHIAQQSQPHRDDGACDNGATVVRVGPDLPSADAAQSTTKNISEQLATNGGQAVAAIGALDAHKINQLLLDEE